MRKKEYVQFSKRMVLFVCISVTCLSLLAMGMCFFREAMEEIAEILQGYTGFATICFAAYSGNSMVEKWLVRRFGAYREEKEKDEEDDEG